VYPSFLENSEMMMESLYQSQKIISKHSFSIFNVARFSQAVVRRKCHNENGKRPHGVLKRSVLSCQYITKNQ
jgi:hypothetical protein